MNQNLISRTSIMQKFSTYTRGFTYYTFIILEWMSNIKKEFFC